MRSRRTALRVGRRRGSDRAPKGARRLFLVVCSCRLHRCARGRRMCSYAWIDFRGGCALLSAQGRRPWEPSASTGTSFGWRDDVELFTTLALVVRSYSHNRLWGFKRVCGSILGFLRERCAVLGRRSIWAVLRLVAAWQVGTGDLWASVACFVNCTLIWQLTVSWSRVLLCLCRPKAVEDGGSRARGPGASSVR